MSLADRLRDLFGTRELSADDEASGAPGGEDDEDDDEDDENPDGMYPLW